MTAASGGWCVWVGCCARPYSKSRIRNKEADRRAGRRAWKPNEHDKRRLFERLGLL